MRRKIVRGFSLVELLMTLAILAVLATATMPLAQIAIQRSREDELRRALREMRNAIDAWKRASDDGRIRREPQQSGYPPSLQSLVDGAINQRDPKGARMYFLRRIPRDPMSDQPPEQAWVLRSYASEATDPQPGEDVFDVFSAAPQTGLNGIPYREW